MQLKRHYSGFTLIELMMVLVILAILLALAVPSFRDTLVKNQTDSIAEEITTALSMARVEAVKRRVPIAICRSSDGASCAGAGDWSDGFILYTDTKTETDADTDVGVVIKAWNGLEPDLSIGLTRNDVGVGFIRYTSLGTLARIENFSSVFNISVAGCSGLPANQVITVNLSGLASKQTQNCP